MTNRNIVLITVDSLRADTFTKMRDGQLTHLSELAEQGTEFTQAVSNGPNTPSSFPSILTGTHALMYGGYDYLTDRRPFLSTTLRDAGFMTVGYHSNPHLGPNRNYNQGFDIFNDGDEDRDDANTLINFVDNNIDSDSWLYSFLRRCWHLLGSATGISAYERAESITDNALIWIDKWNGDRFFLWLHYMDVHYPFQPPTRFLKEIGHEGISSRRIASLNDKMHENPESLSPSDVEDLRALYRGEVKYVDHNIGRLLDTLDALNIRDETMIIVTSDHGESFGEHNRWGHHSLMYDELLRVPLIVDEASRSPEKVDEQVSLIDLFPTICDSCNVTKPDQLQGENLFASDRNQIAIGTSSPWIACREPNWKCLWNTEDNTIMLYKLNDDPHESADVSNEYPAVLERLKGEMEAYREAARQTDTELPNVKDSEEVKQRLKDLGYTE